MAKKNTQKKDYKLIGVVIGALIILGIVITVMTIQKEEIRTQGILEGQENAAQLMLKSIEEKGQVVIQTPQGNVTLIQKEYLQVAQENVVQTIIETIQQQGSVTLNHNGTQMVLVPQQ